MPSFFIQVPGGRNYTSPYSIAPSPLAKDTIIVEKLSNYHKKHHISIGSMLQYIIKVFFGFKVNVEITA
jgi:hypothetical protein